MTLTPYKCIHCKAETSDFAIVRMRFTQTKYSHHYGHNYYEGTQEVDAGKAPVFVCDKCVREMKRFGKHYKLRIVAALIEVLVCLLTILAGQGLWLTGLPFVLVCFLLAMVNEDVQKRAEHRYRNQMNIGTWTKEGHIRMSTLGAISFLGINSCVFLFAAAVLGIFLRGLFLKILAWVLLVLAAVTLITSIVGQISVFAPISEDDRKNAAWYYIAYDENIDLLPDPDEW